MGKLTRGSDFKMNYSSKKGFTLAELLAVIAILGVVALIVFPAVSKTIKNSKEKAYNQQVESILRSAENWTTENMSSLSDTSDNYITVEELRRSGFLESKKVINPITDEEMNGCIIINYDFSHNQYVYQYNDESCDDIQTVPVITLNGDATITINKGETFVDPGYAAIYKGIDITDSVVVTGSVDTSVVDTYTLTYNVSYNGKSAETITRIVHVVIEYRTFREVMEPLLGSAVNDNDPVGNLRYVGSDPDNYVWFNEELWRIVGLFDDPVNGDQVKIIKDVFYVTDEAALFAWDTNNRNDWSSASLKEELNGIYLGDIQKNNPTSYSFIDLEHVWNVGGTSSPEITRSEFYTAERSETISSVMTSSTWQGAIGLIYPSDFGYSTSSENTNCDLSMWDWSGYSDCYENSWLYDGDYNYWAITPESTNTDGVFTIDKKHVALDWVYSYYIGEDSAYNPEYGYVMLSVKPTLYLKSDVVIVDGTGDHDDPYILAMK